MSLCDESRLFSKSTAQLADSMISELWEGWARAINSLHLGALFQALSLPISMLVAWLTFRATTSNLRYSLLVSDVSEQIKQFSQAAKALSVKIECHYKGKYPDGFTNAAARESRTEILTEVKELENRRSVLEVFLSEPKQEELKAKFDEWQEKVLGDQFPVTKKAECCKDHEKPIQDLRNAQAELERYLAKLRKGCIDSSWRFRKTIR